MSEKRLLTVAAILTAVLHVDNAKTVVMFPVPYPSYIIYHTNVAAALANLGHEVWLCVPHYLFQKDLIKEKSVNILIYGEHLGDMTAGIFESTKLVESFWAGENSGGLQLVFTLYWTYQKMCTDVLSDETFVQKVKSLKADLFVLDSIIFNLNMIVLPYKLDIPYALIGTFHDVVVARVPFSPAATPSPSGTMSDKMTFLQRLQVTIMSALSMFFELHYDSSLVSKFAPEKPYVSITELALRSEIFIAELDHILDYPRPTLPNTKLIGGSSASPAKPLVGEFQKFVEGSKNGIVVASFGGSIINVPAYITSKMSAAFSQLDQKVVWRINITSPDLEKILTSNWIPQNDLLGHEKTRLFVSHCGKNGQYEALYHGVPILCLPIYGDQMYNAERIVVKQLGLSVNMRAVTADELAGLMKQVINANKYADNMKRASSLYRDLYKVPMKEAAFWLDHVMTYGGEYMRSASQQMPLYQFLLLDVIAFILSVIALIVIFFYILIKLCCRACRLQKASSKAKQG